MAAAVKVLSWREERVRFGADIPDEINALLQVAAANAHAFEASERALLQARAQAPDQLEVLIALYKLYFYRGFTERAEQMVHEALTRSAKAGGFDSDWRTLDAASADWAALEGPPRVYLYSLKALCFIRLRQSDQAGAVALIDALHRLDPQDQVGVTVLASLADGVGEN
ncbi:MAG: hypothetical protein SVU69_04225 [Pseudomonadota bacterium]|nr:hypothetical protein [Pseudomonadota bacterium]